MDSSGNLAELTSLKYYISACTTCKTPICPSCRAMIFRKNIINCSQTMWEGPHHYIMPNA